MAEFPVGSTDSAAEPYTYDVSSFIAHVREPGVPASQMMRSGHYVTYVHNDSHWFKMDDRSVTRLDAAPTAFPYVVFLVRKGVYVIQGGKITQV